MCRRCASVPRDTAAIGAFEAAPAGLVGRTPWSAADALVGLLAQCKMPISLFRQRDAGVPRGPGGPPHQTPRGPTLPVQACATPVVLRLWLCGFAAAQSGPDLQHLAPVPKHLRRQGRHARCVEGRVDRRLQFAHIAAVLILNAPNGNHLRRDLQVELEPVHMLAGAKRLVAAEIRSGQQFGTGRQVESLAVPVEDRLLGEPAEKPIGPRGWGELHTIPADLLDGIPPHRGPHRAGDQLRPQADAEDGLATCDRLADERHLLAQEGQIVVDRHGAAYEDERVIPPDIRRRRARLVEVGVVHFDAAQPKGRLYQAQAFEGYVAESQHAHERQFAANWKWLRPSAYLEMPR